MVTTKCAKTFGVMKWLAQGVQLPAQSTGKGAEISYNSLKKLTITKKPFYHLLLRTKN